MSLNWDFHRGGGLKPIKPSVGGSMDIFWNNTIGKYLREGTFFLGGGGLGNFGIFSPKKCWPSLAF